jgi:predicted phage terminase large subunit-like protein
MDTTEIRPQPRQEIFMKNPADIVIFGGAAGGGKTFALLMEPLRHKGNKDFGAVVFRRSIAEITKEGGLWDEAGKLYPLLGGKGNENEHQFNFPEGSRITFGHLQYDDTVNDWKSSQLPLELFDQLETFTEHQFFYMLSRNRSTCGVRPYVRASANPEPGWLADFLEWWIDEDGYARLDRVGVIRWMIRRDDRIIWADTREELTEKYPDALPKSVTFILSTVYDNKILLDKDPGYLANLQALPLVDRERLLGDRARGGNWKIKPSAGKVFNRDWFEIVDAVPAGGREVRFWDFASTEKKLEKDDPDFTSSTKAKMVGGITYILDCTNDQLDPVKTDAKVKNTASQDGRSCAVRWEMEGGASGKRDTRYLTRMLVGYDAKGVRPRGDKIQRAKPLAAQAEAGNAKLLRGPWNKIFLDMMHAFPTEGVHDDIPDSADGVFDELTNPVREARSEQG